VAPATPRMDQAKLQPRPARQSAQVGKAALSGAAPGSAGLRAVHVFYGGSALALLASVVIHVVMVLAATLVYFQATRGAAPSARGEVLLTPVSELELQSAQDAALSADVPRIPDSALGETPAGTGLDMPSGDDLPGAGAGDIGEIAEALRGTGGGTDDGSGLGAGGTGGGAASFFGVEARGSRFAFVVDVSGSMQGEKIERLKVELSESLGSLLEHMSFLVVAFSSEAYPLGGRLRWTEAGDDGKRWALDKVAEFVATGGTVPGPALEAVFNMSPRPDAVYFMTDGMFDPAVEDQITFLNRSGKKVAIHCITFVDRSSEEMMRRIAQNSGGTYTHIEGPRR